MDRQIFKQQVNIRTIIFCSFAIPICITWQSLDPGSRGEMRTARPSRFAGLFCVHVGALFGYLHSFQHWLFQNGPLQRKRLPSPTGVVKRTPPAASIPSVICECQHQIHLVLCQPRQRLTIFPPASLRHITIDCVLLFFFNQIVKLCRRGGAIILVPLHTTKSSASKSLPAHIGAPINRIR